MVWVCTTIPVMIYSIFHWIITDNNFLNLYCEKSLKMIDGLFKKKRHKGLIELAREFDYSVEKISELFEYKNEFDAFNKLDVLNAAIEQMQVNAYDQCQNCRNRTSEWDGHLQCNVEGLQKINELKKIPHCAAQDEIYKIRKHEKEN